MPQALGGPASVTMNGRKKMKKGMKNKRKRSTRKKMRKGGMIRKGKY